MIYKARDHLDVLRGIKALEKLPSHEIDQNADLEATQVQNGI